MRESECVCERELEYRFGGAGAAGAGVVRFRANMAHIRQSRPDSALGFRAKALETSKLFPPELCSPIQS